MTPAIIVHGGAGAWKLDSIRLQEGIEACRQAAETGRQILLGGGSALDAVEQAVRILEDCPALDAGIGSYLTTEGMVEVDALIMDGQSLNLGCVAAVQRIQNPISLARMVMEQTEHAFLMGAGAGKFADAIGFPRIENERLIVPEELQKMHELKADDTYLTHHVFTEPGSMGDTVGAVAIDHDGCLAAATSTGGTRNQMPGRVGDCSLVGSGGYADNFAGGVSATGHGESLMKVVISKQVCDMMRLGMTPTGACEAALHMLQQRLPETGKGGLIAINPHGHVGLAFNTDAMPYAYTKGNEAVRAGR
ncbi:MAG: isoaspartyl peptidase/L-asparaginase [Ardenticatenaceae bacterium]|nr:isoaspartyl peptidase/L-asparaginase [Ardenticatenaceae bacterium]